MKPSNWSRLFEKDGTGTVVGGVSMEIHLAKFAPKAKEPVKPTKETPTPATRAP